LLRSVYTENDRDSKRGLAALV